MVTYCSSCGLKLNESLGMDHYILCSRCNRFIPIGSQSGINKSKGGMNMTEKKVSPKTPKPEKAKGVLAERKSKAQSVYDTLEGTPEDKRKFASALYQIASKTIKG